MPLPVRRQVSQTWGARQRWSTRLQASRASTAGTFGTIRQIWQPSLFNVGLGSCGKIFPAEFSHVLGQPRAVCTRVNHSSSWLIARLELHSPVQPARLYTSKFCDGIRFPSPERVANPSGFRCQELNCDRESPVFGLIPLGHELL